MIRILFIFTHHLIIVRKMRNQDHLELITEFVMEHHPVPMDVIHFAVIVDSPDDMNQLKKSVIVNFSGAVKLNVKNVLNKLRLTLVCE